MYKKSKAKVMRRNMELFRAILLYIYNHHEYKVWEIQLDQFTLEETEYHIEFLIKDGYLEGLDMKGVQVTPEWRDLSLTTRGHDLAIAIENEEDWNKIKQASAERNERFTISFVNQYLFDSKPSITNISGDLIKGDKVGGDKVGGDKNTTNSNPQNGTTTGNAASLVLRIRNPVKPSATSETEWKKLRLFISITSDNGISSRNGAIKLTIAYPLVLSNSTDILFRGADFNKSVGLDLVKFEDTIPYANSIRIQWGTNTNNLILPGDWYDFHGNPISLDVPATLQNPTYLMRTELFTDNTYPKKMLFSIRQRTSEDLFDIRPVTNETYDEITASFWETYHLARSKRITR